MTAPANGAAALASGGIGCCLHLAIAIAKRPAVEWRAACRELPRECQDPERRCTGPHGCRRRVADYLAVQYRILESGWQPRGARDGTR